ncbi:MAG: uroporphyrinogen-III C-methyltransferase [Gammaproteobacteria bacterium]|nr:uroporphyrinogen-III C-methyltransferase [Gammaproteobacteria bacterium]
MADEQIVEPELTQPKIKPRNKGVMAILFLSLCFAILICVFGVYTLIKSNRLLTQNFAFLQTQSAFDAKTFTNLAQSIARIDQETKQSQALSTEGVRLIKEWQEAQNGDLKQWQVAESMYLVRLANDLVQLSYNADSALKLLERAELVLQNQNDPSLFSIKKSLAEDKAKLKALPQLDVTQVFLQITALATQLNQLPLPATPLPPTGTNANATMNTEDPWWQRGLQQSLNVLRKIVIIRKTDGNTPPLVLPDEKLFLYQNLQAQSEATSWGLLHRNQMIYQTSLNKMNYWIKTYFAQDAQATQSVLETIAALQQLNVAPPDINLGETLQQFDAYFRNQQTAKAP